MIPNLLGQTIDNKYQILSLLGEGGMGVVYKAEQKELSRFVAIKILKSIINDDKNDTARFLREAKILCRLRHKNIIKVFGFGLFAQSYPYMVMEYVEGLSLNTILNKEEKFSWQRTVDLGKQIAEAMSYSHQEGIIHRDLKPQNIIILPDSKDNFEIKIIDFGLAHLTESNETNTKKLTKTGLLLGSPQYFSPEQCLGKKVDERSDIYSLGLILYECFTGLKAFQAENPIALLHLHLNEFPKPIESKLIENEHCKLLSNIIFKSIQKSASDRFQSMSELALALNLLLKEQLSQEQIQFIQPKNISKEKKLTHNFFTKKNISIALFFLIFCLTIFIWLKKNELSQLISKKFSSRSHSNSFQDKLNSQFIELDTIISDASNAIAHNNEQEAENLVLNSIQKLYKLSKENFRNKTSLRLELNWRLYCLSNIITRFKHLSHTKLLSRMQPLVSTYHSSIYNDKFSTSSYERYFHNIALARIYAICGQEKASIDKYCLAIFSYSQMDNFENISSPLDEVRILIQQKKITDPNLIQDIDFSELEAIKNQTHKKKYILYLASKIKNYFFKNNFIVLNHPYDLSVLGDVFQKYNRTDEAISCFKQADQLTLNAHYIDYPFYCLPKFYLDQNNIVKAKNEFSIFEKDRLNKIASLNEEYNYKNIESQTKIFQKALKNKENQFLSYKECSKYIFLSEQAKKQKHNTKAILFAEKSLESLLKPDYYQNISETLSITNLISSLRKLCCEEPIISSQKIAKLLVEINKKDFFIPNDKYAELNYNFARLYLNCNEINEALKCYTASIESYIYNNDYSSAQKKYFELSNDLAKDIFFTEYKTKYAYEYSLLNLATVKALLNSNKNEANKLIDMTKSEITTNKKLNSEQKCHLYKKLGIIYMDNLKQFDDAETYLLKAYELSKNNSIKDPLTQAFCELELVKLYFLKNDINKSEHHLYAIENYVEQANLEPNSNSYYHYQDLFDLWFFKIKFAKQTK